MSEPVRTVAVVDGNSLLHRAFHALPTSMTAPDGRPTNAAFGFVSMIVKMVTELAPDGVVVAWDCGKPAFRMEALAQYKMHRPPTAEELRTQFPMVKKLMDALGVPQVEVEGWEADDILGTLAVRGRECGVEVLLVTGDRDALQLVGNGVTVISTQKGVSDIKIYDAAAVEERLGVRPDQIVDYLGLKGDTSDNIPGVPGIGEKTAAKLIGEHGSLNAVLEAAEDIPGKLGENLRAHADAARTSRLVATIRTDVPIDLDLAQVSWGAFSPKNAAEAFGELRFTSLLERALATAPAAGGGAGIGGATMPRAASQDAGPAEAEVAAAPAATTPPEAAPWPLASGGAALERVREWVASPEWLGVALDDGTCESLFAVRRDLAVAHAGEVALLEGDAVETGFAALLARGRLAAGDVKALLHALSGGGETPGAPPAAPDPARLFDCGIAAYLLESNRSSYAIGALSADYLGSPLQAATEERPIAAIEAQAAALLAPELERLVGDDGSAEVLETIEMPLLPILERMEHVGVGLDTAVLGKLAGEAATSIDSLVREIFDLAGTEFTIDSPKQLGEILFGKLGLPTSKRTKTGFSTDASVLASLAPLHPIAEKIVAYRELTKLKSTYIDALPRMIAEDGRLHTTFNQTVAATGRLSSSNPNLQNIPVRTELGRRIRAAFVPAEPGDLIVSADYSQIELRILAHLSGDPGLIDAFTSGADFHTATAARVFGVPEGEPVPPGLRARAKAVNFGIVYGQSAHGLADSLKIQHAEAQTMIDRYYAAYPRVREFLDETVASAHRDGFAVTMFGRKRRIPELKSGNHNLRSFGERTAMNHPMQGSAADIMKLAMIEVDRRMSAEGLRARMVLQVHDELVFESPAEEVPALSALACEAMGGVADLAVPLDVSVASGANWAAAK